MESGMKYKVSLFTKLVANANNRLKHFLAVKSKNVVTLSVDSVFTDPKIGSRLAVSSDTGSGLFLGGHRFLKKARGMSSRSPFVGCIRNLHLNNDPVDLTTTEGAVGDITIGTCPTN